MRKQIISKNTEKSNELYTVLPVFKKGIADVGSKIEYCLDINDLPNEKWVDVIGYDGYYQISNMGRLKSLEREIPNARGCGYRTLKEKIKKLKWHNKRNQLECLYSVESVNKRFNFPKQVALHFIPNYNNETVYHIDGSVFNCKVSNLIKVTSKNVIELYNNKKTFISNEVSELLHKMGYKKCSICKSIKKNIYFSKSKRNRGVNNNCKKCSNESVRVSRLSKCLF